MKALLGGFFLAAIFGFLAWLFAPDLVRDVGLWGKPLEVAADAHFKEGKCRTKLFVIAFCELKYDVAGKPAAAEYFMFGSPAGEGFDFLKPKGANEPITTSIGQNNLVNRLVSFAALVAAGLAFVIGSILTFIRERRAA